MSEDALEFAFTLYVGSLDAQGEPDPKAFADAWNKLRRILSSELRKRGLSEAPPTFLGIYGYDSWREPPPGGIWELIQDCFTSVFVERLHLLRALHAKLEHIEGIAFRYIRNALHDRHRRGDPLGYRVYQVIHAAASGAVARGWLEIVENGPAIGNEAVLGATGRDRSLLDSGDAPEDGLEGLWVELVSATPKERPRVEDRLGEVLYREALLTGPFRFGDVLHDFKTEVRARWGMAWRRRIAGVAEEEDEAWREMRLWASPRGVEGTVDFDKLWHCVSEQLAGQGKTKKTRHHLGKLWLFVRGWIAEAGEEELPSARELEKQLGIPRKSMPGLLSILRGRLLACRGA